MFLRKQAPATPALDYTLSTSPMPLQVGLVDGPPDSTLTLHAASPTAQAVACSKITVTVVPGDDAGALTNDAGQMTATVFPAQRWKSTHGGNVFTFTPASGETVQVDQKGFWFRFADIAVNTTVGITPLTVTDTTADTRTTTFQVGKFPRGFFIGDLRLTTLDDEDGRAAVPAGTAIRLTWEASNGPNLTYRLLYDTTTPVDVTAIRTWPPPVVPGYTIQHDTTFHLRARLSTGAITLDTFTSTTVAVTNPRLTAGTITVTGDTGAEPGSALTVTGPTQLNGRTTVGPSASKADDAVLDVTGMLTASTTSLFIPQGSKGYLELWLLDANELALAATQWVSKLAGPFKSDGFIIGVVVTNDKSNTGTYYMLAQMSTSTGGFAGGGFHCQSGDPQIVFQTVVVPVMKGTKWNLFARRDQKKEDTPPELVFGWIPLGYGGGMGPVTATAAAPEGVVLPAWPKDAR